MHLISRRRFIRSCLYGGLGSYLSFLDPYRAGSNEKPDPNFEPGYLALHRTGELKKRGEKLWEMMRSCELCPRMCGVNKLKGEKGVCQANSQLEISSYHPHYGEEKPLVGKGGSGTVFLTNCGLRCVFCINWEISQGGDGAKRSIEDFADMMLILHINGIDAFNTYALGIGITSTNRKTHQLCIDTLPEEVKKRLR